MMKPLICKQCGGTINPRTNVCEYCGTSYRNEYASGPYEPIHIVYEQPNVHTCVANVAVPMEILKSAKAEGLTKYTLERLSNELAKTIEPFMNVEVSDDPLHNMRNFRGRIRILDPEYRFR